VEVREVMTADVVSIPPELTLQDAASIMKTLDVASLPVSDGERLIGVITDRDIAVRAIAEGRDPRTTDVADVMTAEVVCCQPDDELQRAAQLMRREQLRRLLVVDAGGRLVGIVSFGDLVRDIGDEEPAGEPLERVAEPLQVER
jgi:CBS domain-containing protein